MATISSLGVGSGLDIKNIVAQLVALEKKPLDKLKLDAAATQTKITTFGQIKSLVSTLQDAVGRLTSVTGWNAVSATSSNKDYVSASAIGGTQATSFSVEVQSLARARATASQSLPAGAALGQGTLTLTVNGTAVNIEVGAADTLAGIAGKINGSAAGVTATILNDGAGERLLLTSKATGLSGAFALTVSDVDGNNADDLGLSRLLFNTTETKTAADAQATINNIPVTSSTNTFTNVVSGVTLTAAKETEAGKPVTITVAPDSSAVKANIEAFVKAYNDINGVLNEATKFDQATGVGGLLQGDSTTLSLQNALRAAVQSVTSGGTFSRLSDIGISAQRGGNLEINSTKLSKALEQPDALKTLFSSTGTGSAEGIAVRLKKVTTALLATDGFFKRKDDSLNRVLDDNAKDQERVNNKVSRIETQLNRKYSALDSQLSSLNALNNYLSQQISQWNKSNS
ncbi:MAG TPA: flagellar cap protein FliD [Curvibacter sp.]|nr:flagellar cap protein FliD [Curvibacter sp.]